MSRENQVLTLTSTFACKVPWGRFSTSDLHRLIQYAQGRGGEDFTEFLADGVRKMIRGEDLSSPEVAPELLLDFTDLLGRRRVWFSNAFREHVLEPALKERAVRPVESGPSFDIPREGMKDENVRAKLRQIGDGDIFGSASWILYFIGEVEKEARGEASDLDQIVRYLWYVKGEDEDGNPKIFTVTVDWLSGRQEWYVDAFQLVDDGWSASYRTFSVRKRKARGQATAGPQDS